MNYSYSQMSSQENRTHTNIHTQGKEKMSEKNTIDSWRTGILEAKNQREEMEGRGQRKEQPRNLHKDPCSLSLNKSMCICKGKFHKARKVAIGSM